MNKIKLSFPIFFLERYLLLLYLTVIIDSTPINIDKNLMLNVENRKLCHMLWESRNKCLMRCLIDSDMHAPTDLLANILKNTAYRAQVLN
jgi:hypothetical protein